MKAKNKRSFFYHFNKPMTQRTGEVKWSVHFADRCHIVSNIECLVPAWSRPRNTQPRAVMSGKCYEVLVKDGIATIK